MIITRRNGSTIGEFHSVVAAIRAGVDLTDANLTFANLSDADLSDANLTRAVLTGAKLTRAVLTGAKLTGATVTVGNRIVTL